MWQTNSVLRGPLNMFCPFVLTCRWPRKWLHWSQMSTNALEERAKPKGHELRVTSCWLKERTESCSPDVVVRYKNILVYFTTLLTCDTKTQNSSLFQDFTHFESISSPTQTLLSDKWKGQHWTDPGHLRGVTCSFAFNPCLTLCPFSPAL